MLGVTFDQIGAMFRALFILGVMALAVLKLGSELDPTTIEVGSPEWAAYVKQYRHLRV